MRKLVLVTLVIAGSVAIPAVALASGSSGTGSTGIDCQSTSWTTVPVSTSSTTFAAVSALSIDPESIYPMSITLSGNLTGKPAAFEIQDVWVGGTTYAEPGVASFKPVAGGSSFSFTWVDPGGAAAARAHQLSILWRLDSTSGTSTLTDADLVVSYENEVCPGSN